MTNLPKPGEQIDESITDVFELNFGDSNAIMDNNLLDAGHHCHSDQQCDSTLKCVPLYSWPSSLPLHSNNSNSITAVLSTHLKRSIESYTNKLNVCASKNCNSSCENITSAGIDCPEDSFFEEWKDDDNCCIQT